MYRSLLTCDENLREDPHLPISNSAQRSDPVLLSLLGLFYRFLFGFIGLFWHVMDTWGENPICQSSTCAEKWSCFALSCTSLLVFMGLIWHVLLTWGEIAICRSPTARPRHLRWLVDCLSLCRSTHPYEWVMSPDSHTTESHDKYKVFRHVTSIRYCTDMRVSAASIKARGCSIWVKTPVWVKSLEDFSYEWNTLD